MRWSIRVGEDLDFDPSEVNAEGFDAVTAFEIIEHLVNPMPMLQQNQSAEITGVHSHAIVVRVSV